MRVTHLLASALLAVVVAGCSADDGGADRKTDKSGPDKSEPDNIGPDETGTDKTSPSLDPIEQAVDAAFRSYADAYLGGDSATAFTFLSPRCQQASSYDAFLAAAEQVTAGDNDLSYTVDAIDVTGEQARVEVSSAVRTLSDPVHTRWALLDGEWWLDGC